MYITFEIKITVGNNTDFDRKYFDLDYEPIKEDLDEYAKEEGYKGVEEWLRAFMSPEDWTEEEIQEILGCLEKDGSYNVEYLLPKVEIQDLEKFIVKKYQTKVECWILRELTIDSSKDLNDLINYEF